MSGAETVCLHPDPRFDTTLSSASPWKPFLRCQSDIHTPSVMITIPVLTLIKAVGRDTPTSPSPSFWKQHNHIRVKLIVSYGNQLCRAPAGEALLSCFHFLPVWARESSFTYLGERIGKGHRRETKRYSGIKWKGSGSHSGIACLSHNFVWVEFQISRILKTGRVTI